MRHPILSIAFTLLGTFAVTAQQTGITPMQVMKLRQVTGVYPHPDANSELVAFTRAEPRSPAEAPGGARSHLYLLEPGGGGQLTERLLIGGTKSASGVAWDPRGEHLTFVEKRKGDDHPEVYALSVKTGEVTRVTDTPRGVSSYKWRPDGEAIAYTVLDPHPPARDAARKRGFRPRIVNEDFRHVSLWLWERESGGVQRLTSGKTVYSYEWSPVGTHLAAGLAPHNLTDDRYMFTRLHRIEPTTGAVKLLVDNPGKLGAYSWSPDGKRLAYIGAFDQNDPHAGTLFVTDSAGGAPRALTAEFKGMVNDVAWASGDGLVCAISEGVQSSVVFVDVGTGNFRRPERAPKLAFSAVKMAGDTRAYVVASTPKFPSEVFRLVAGDDSSLDATILTDSNPWLSDVALGDQKVVRFAARDGLEIEGLMLYPVGYEQGKRYPMVIVAHGGPESHFSDGWNTNYGRWGQMLCARGYFAWYPNYRASTGYGVEFAKADHGDPMGAEFTDHLDAIDHFADLGLIDRARVGVGGGSYGGYTAAWAATRHTDHFAAAVSFVPFVDIRTKWFTSDIPYEFYYVHYQEKWPHEQPGLLSDRSPLSWADRCETPLLLLGGTADPRVHPSQPFMLYSAVKFTTSTPVRYVQYLGEGHGNRQNVNQYDYALRTLRWFDHYLSSPDQRDAEPPPFDVDYGEWMKAASSKK